MYPCKASPMYYFLQWFLKNKDRKSVQAFNSSFRYIDDVLSRFGDCLHLIYLNDNGYDWHLQVCYLLWPSPSNDNNWRLILYDKRDDFTFSIVNFLFISSNIPASSAYGIYISQLVRYSKACAQLSDCWTEQVSYKKQELLTVCEHMCSPRLFSGVRVAHRLRFLCCGFLFLFFCFLCVCFCFCFLFLFIFCLFFVFVLCLVRQVVPVSLDCPFLIAPSFFLTFICYIKGYSKKERQFNR